MALPIWANYMKECYNNEDLHISNEAFEAPKNLSIETDCDKWKEDQQETKEDFPDEF
jgi:penicillin-binding protein 1A